MSEAQKPQRKRSGMYAFLRGLGDVVFHTVLPVKYHNAERIQGEGPFIIIGNHQCWIDPVVMAVPMRKRQISLLAKKEVGAGGKLTKLMRNMHVVLVNRGNTDMEAMRACMKVVRDGHVLGIFPEGTRYHKGVMEELESGVAMIALRAGVPLYPMLIPTKMKLFRRNDCYVGEPIPLDDLREKGINKETCAELLQRITATYADLLKAAEEK
ncbi:MAG: 1-acyl-sn-glycerol-3-phosphate acyltransferase [Clostridiales bacterium]|nr:1-acyl-sn-glycerol-3-phosphate acyltransferase [Clostridiales bacterium]